MNKTLCNHAVATFAPPVTPGRLTRIFTLLFLLAGVVPVTRAADTFIKDLSSASNVVVTATAVHPTDGSVFVVGTFSGAPVTIGNKVLSLAGGKPTGFIAKMGSDGAWRWAGTLADTDGRGSLVPRSLTVAANNVYVCGDATNGVVISVQNGVATYPGSLSRNNVSRAPFVVKFDTEGRTIWAQMASNSDAAAGGSDAFAYDLAVDNANNVYVCGSFRSDQISNPALGLNFGTNHAFRVRDPSGTSGNTDWNYLTRDGFVAKLEGLSGNWKWVATGGGMEDESANGNAAFGPYGGGFFGISVDSANNVYVIGNGYGDYSNNRQGALINAYMTVTKWNSDGLGGSVPLYLPTDAGAFVAKISGSGSSEGQWSSGNFRCIPTPAPAIGTHWYGAPTYARSISVVQDQVYVAYQQAGGGAANATSRILQIKRLKLDLSAADAAASVVVNGSIGTNDLATGKSLSSDSAGNLYLMGKISYPGAVFTNTGSAFTSIPVSASANLFVAKLNSTLNWQWVNTASGSLPQFGEIVGAADPQTGRLYFSGSFANGVLDLGPPATDTLLPASGIQGPAYRSFLSAIQPNADFLQQVTFTLVTPFGADQAQPGQTPQTVFAGATIQVSVPPVLYEDEQGKDIDASNADGIKARAVTRHTCTGFEVLGTANAGNSASYSFTITADTELRFNWLTEYALDVRNNLTNSQGGLTSTAAGNPDPIVQKHWIAEGTITTAFIDGVIPSPNPNEFGTRYRSTGYFASGASAPVGNALRCTGSALDLGARTAYNPGNNPWTVEFWYRSEAIDVYSRRLINWGNLVYVSQENMNLVFNSAASFSGNVTLASAPLRLNEWHHLALVNDTTNWIVFADGQPIATQPVTAALGSPTSSLLLGQFFNGELDEFRMWKTARTADQIQQYMQVPLANLDDPTLVAYWAFDDAATGTVADLKNPGFTAAVTAPNSAFAGTVPARTGQFVPWASVQSRQQVPQFLMNRSAVIEYQWVKENRIQVSAVPAILANVPTVVGGGITNTGSGEFWFTNGTTVRISAPELVSFTNTASKSLSGFMSGAGNVTTVTGDGTRAANFRYYDIPSLTQGSSLVWNYANRIYKGAVTIGNPLDFSAGGTFTGSEVISNLSRYNLALGPVATTIISNAPAGSTIDDMRVWDDVADKLYPVRPGTILLEWAPLQNGDDNLLTQITVSFPAASSASVNHIANTPPVPLNANAGDTNHFVGLKYSERSSTFVTDAGEFSVPDTGFDQAFWSVLLFSERTDGTAANGDLTRERLRVRTVRTRRWSDNLIQSTATIGTAITSPLHSPSAPFNGYVYFSKGRYNASLHNRATRQGPIIPVNRYFGPDNSNTLVVVWYTNQLGTFWPWQSVQYSNNWPATANRLVIASQLGSDGRNASGSAQPSFDSTRYSNVQIYNQPDLDLPGYNPNEEHALVAPSLLYAAAGDAPPAAFALRNNLNVTNQDSTYTSDPYVLVQYVDNQSQQPGMAVYPVQVQDTNYPALRADFPPGTNVLAKSVVIATNGVLDFYLPNYQSLFLANEPVDLDLNDNFVGVISGRYYLLTNSPGKFNLSKTVGGAPITATALSLTDYPVVSVTRAFPYVFEYSMKAGQPVQPPYPLQLVVGATPCSATVGQNLDPNQLVYWEDRKSQPWAISGSTNPAAGLRAQFYYPLQPAFWYPSNLLGSCIPYVANPAPVWVTNHVTWPASVPVLKAGETLTFAGGENRADNPTAPGLPGIVGWSAGKVVYDDANPNLNGATLLANTLVRMAAPLTTLQIPLPVANVPAELQPAAGNVTVNGTKWFFNKLPASLNQRVFYDQSSQTLNVRGFLNGKTIGDSTLVAAPGSIYTLQPNILSLNDSNLLANLVSAASPAWSSAVASLVGLSRDPGNLQTNYPGSGGSIYGIGLEAARAADGTVLFGQARPANQFGPGLALVPNQSLLDPYGNMRDGYVTLAENDDASLGAAPVALHIIRIKKQPALRGAIQTISPANAFDEKITLRHSADFGANVGDLVFEWYYRPDDGAVVGPPDLSPAAWSLFSDPSGAGGRGLQEINLVGNSVTALSDNRFFVRYRHYNSSSGWSQWAGAANSRPPVGSESATNTYVPQLANGWVKRVIDGLNPFEARITDFRSGTTPSTYASMVQQAGSPYRGNVALSSDPNTIQNTGLIELYQTVLNRASALSINLSTPVSTPAVNNAIILAASRLADLYLMLGNEAYSDALDPTIGFGTSSGTYGSLAPTIFCFQNQMPSLLDEQLALLRGRDSEGAYPAYNRLLWNFTSGEGEAAYALSYQITDQNKDGFINAADAQTMFPQGHGDAWGHYLSAVRTYYDLLRHPYFNWQARSESMQIQGVVVAVDFLDERKFAQAAAAKAKAGADIAAETYRSRYTEDPDGQWQGYQDSDTTRGWGVAEWSRRAACGAFFDWVTANAILPAAVTNKVGIERVDRTTVQDIKEIAAQASEVRRQFDDANIGLNPLGLATDVVPFDVDPTGLTAGSLTPATHFEQVYARALNAMTNALVMFNNANNLNKMLREVQATADQFAKDSADQDNDFRNRLIEIFGTPYSGVIGAGKTYPAGYNGPDIYLYMYADTTGLESVPPPTDTFQAFFKPLPNGFVNTGAPGGGGNTIAEVFSKYFPNDVPNVSYSAQTNINYGAELVLNLPTTAKGYAFQAPASWGSRSAPGQIQQVLSEMVQAEASLRLALNDYDGVLSDLQTLLDLIHAQSDLQTSSIQLQETGIQNAQNVQSRIETLRGVAAAASLAGEVVDQTVDGTIKGLPETMGLANDPSFSLRGAIRLGGIAAYVGIKGTALGAEQSASALEGQQSIADAQTGLNIQKEDYKYAIKEQLKEFETMLGDEAKARIEVFRRQEALRQISDKYRSQLQAGFRLLEERERHNKATAGAVQQNRYQDFTFRVTRNDALSKYRAAFDLAARYAYMTAKAYDYETNLDPNDPASARSLLARIVQAQTLGALENGVPRLGSGGLADVLATLNLNFAVLKSQMGFNNPQGESSQFSLRQGLFRMSNTNSAAWQTQLEKYRVPDLWQVPEFRRYCRAFAPESAGAQPGLVIPFGSQIVFGKNFFGWPLGPGDSAYDPTLFATKIRSVGVWFDNYAGEGLASTPRVYLVPCGVDIMQVPTSASLSTREWNVVDQRIPVPLPVSSGNLSDPNYIPVNNSLNGTLAEIRRYSSFRAYHDAGFNQNQMSFDSRLVARSVWNTRWLLVIPGGTFLSDQTEGLDTFIYGLKSATGPVVDSRGNRRDGNGVKDVKLSFQTYSVSGN